ncbi:hypothetical protein IWX91DRAFT_345354 [Phyllosticta citricarpa]
MSSSRPRAIVHFLRWHKFVSLLWGSIITFEASQQTVRRQSSSMKDPGKQSMGQNKRSVDKACSCRISNLSLHRARSCTWLGHLHSA